MNSLSQHSFVYSGNCENGILSILVVLNNAGMNKGYLKTNGVHASSGTLNASMKSRTVISDFVSLPSLHRLPSLVKENIQFDSPEICFNFSKM